MIEKRRHPRYDVAKLSELKGSLGNGRKQSHLVMLGLGGCGFFSDPSEDLLPNQSKIECSFSCEGVLKPSITLKAHIAYAQPLMVERAKKVFYGIEFEPDQDALIRPLITHLENLAKQNKIKVCS